MQTVKFRLYHTIVLTVVHKVRQLEAQGDGHLLGGVPGHAGQVEGPVQLPVRALG